jgi:hypothetical protein
VTKLDYLWECPKCGAQLGQPTASSATFGPPTCSLMHEPTEMEQRSASRWMRQFEVPTCTCGHPAGDHGRASGGLHISWGRCFREDCDCPRYVPEDKAA